MDKDSKEYEPEQHFQVPRQYALVQWDPDMLDWYRQSSPKAKVGDVPWLERCVYLGEIPNMPGHCIVVGQRSGKTFIGWHIENFVELTIEEL